MVTVLIREQSAQLSAIMLIQISRNQGVRAASLIRLSASSKRVGEEVGNQVCSSFTDPVECANSALSAGAKNLKTLKAQVDINQSYAIVSR